MLKDVQEALQQAKEGGGQKVEGAQLGVKSSGETVRMIMHHSRDTAEKQWHETTVIALQVGRSRRPGRLVGQVGRSIRRIR